MYKINKILIANRGEIAVRIIRSCRVLGIKTVLAASKVDSDTLGVRLADETVYIGEAGVSTYLDIPALIKAAKETGADAIHPGYGFLAENPEMALACSKANIIFIGPKVEHIVELGNKLKARAIAAECGISCIPGSGNLDTFEEVKDAIKEIGLPIMLKAVAGGGGRGMKIITENDKDNIKQIYEGAAAESRSAFGNRTLYVEKYIEHARHIEVQIIGDKFGDIIHLGERDCSTQRRHQKLIEEAGAPNISDALRKDLWRAAVKLTKHINYENVGTVEFIVDQDREEFYFLEVNTRVQVEHPVTEEITGLDLISEMIKVAGGDEISFIQNDVQFYGHAIECRINAEVAEENFRPTPGDITRWEIPQGPGVRVDTHCYHGYSVPVYFDSLLCKLIVRGTSRDHAIKRMLAALDEFVVEGISTTIDFHKKIISSQEFKSGQVHTRLLENINY